MEVEPSIEAAGRLARDRGRGNVLAPRSCEALGAAGLVACIRYELGRTIGLPVAAKPRAPAIVGQSRVETHDSLESILLL